MISQKRVAILGFLIIFLITGCASKHLKQEDIQGIKKLAIVTYLRNKKLLILDHTRIREQSYNYGQYGTFSSLLEVLIVNVFAAATISSSLGGNPDSLRQSVSDFPIKKVFDDNITKNISKALINYQIINPQEADNLINKYIEKKNAKNKKIENYTVLSNKLGADTVLEIDFVYGLAAYGGKVKPSVVIAAEVSVIDAQKNKIIMKKAILSDSYYKRYYTIDKYTANEGELFRKEMLEAIRGFTHLVTTEFGVELSLKEKSQWRTK